MDGHHMTPHLDQVASTGKVIQIDTNGTNVADHPPSTCFRKGVTAPCWITPLEQCVVLFSSNNYLSVSLFQGGLQFIKSNLCVFVTISLFQRCGIQWMGTKPDSSLCKGFCTVALVVPCRN